jgi:hypothetical protein
MKNLVAASLRCALRTTHQKTSDFDGRTLLDSYTNPIENP